MASIPELVAVLNASQNRIESIRACLAQAINESEAAMGGILMVTGGVPIGQMNKITAILTAGKADLHKTLVMHTVAASEIQLYINRLQGRG